jgi:hypothetical protein
MSFAQYTPEDKYFGTPYFDRDEVREQPHSHRYVHGGFAGTDTRFSFYYPPASRYGGRFFTAIEGGPGGHEDRAAAMGPDAGLPGMDFAFAHGAYLVESNGGHIAPAGVSRGRSRTDGSITSYRASAQSSRIARALATQIYGERPRRGYIFGPSGGGWRTILCIENTRGIWDGAVPYISPAGHGVSFPSMISNLVRVLGDRLAGVVAAFEPGGSGDPFTGLTSVQRAELAGAYRAGLQPGAEFQLANPALELGVLLTTSVMHADYDPEYFEEFWTVPGHRGADGELTAELVDTELTVASSFTAGELSSRFPAELDRFVVGGRSLPEGTVLGIRMPRQQRGCGPAPALLRGCDVEVLAGASTGSRFVCLGAVDDLLVLDLADPDGLRAIGPGDLLHLHNRRYLAYCHAYRHQIDADADECRQFIVGGHPVYPQRARSVADVLAGVRTTGRFETKVIYVASVNDTLASPLGGTVSWAAQARAALGDRAGEKLRVWLNDNSGHVVPARRPAGMVPVTETRLVDWTGIIETAVADVIAWVEDAMPPPADTVFAVADGRIALAPRAIDRGGVQPVVHCLADGQIRTQARAGQPVHLTALVEVPPGAGAVTAVEWDLAGDGSWAADPAGAAAAVRHAYAEPGTYYPSVRVTTQRPQDAGTAYGRMRNLARVRIDVS